MRQTTKIIASILFALSFALAGSFTVGASEVYKWVDEEGKMHFTDRPENVPAKYRKKSETINIKKRQPIATDDQGKAKKKPVNRRRTPRSLQGGTQVKSVVAPLIAKGGGLFVDAIFSGGGKQRLILDTGASLVVVTEEVGISMGLGDYKNYPRLPITTASGSSWTYLAVVDRVSVGEAVAEDVVVGVSPDLPGHVIGLLGQTYLNQFVYQIDAARRRLVLIQGQPGEEERNGQTRSWWQSQFREAAQNVRVYRSIENIANDPGHPDYNQLQTTFKGMTIKDFQKLHRFYRKVYDKLSRRAVNAGVPDSWRAYP